MDIADHISKLIDLKLELHDMDKPDAAVELWDPAVFSLSFLEEKHMEKKEKIRTSIEATKRLITQYLEEK
jgi:hypothetical protein